MRCGVLGRSPSNVMRWQVPQCLGGSAADTATIACRRRPGIQSHVVGGGRCSFELPVPQGVDAGAGLGQASRPDNRAVHFQSSGPGGGRNRYVKLPSCVATAQEARLREAQAALKAEGANLTKLVEASAGLGGVEDDARQGLARANEELTREREAQARAWAPMALPVLALLNSLAGGPVLVSASVDVKRRQPSKSNRLSQVLHGVFSCGGTTVRGLPDQAAAGAWSAQVRELAAARKQLAELQAEAKAADEAAQRLEEAAAGLREALTLKDVDIQRRACIPCFL